MWGGGGGGGGSITKYGSSLHMSILSMYIMVCLYEPSSIFVLEPQTTTPAATSSTSYLSAPSSTSYLSTPSSRATVSMSHLPKPSSSLSIYSQSSSSSSMRMQKSTSYLLPTTSPNHPASPSAHPTPISKLYVLWCMDSRMPSSHEHVSH